VPERVRSQPVGMQARLKPNIDISKFEAVG
jgi:hypothetical protein